MHIKTILLLSLVHASASQVSCVSYKNCLNDCVANCDSGIGHQATVVTGRPGKAGRKGDIGPKGTKGEPGIKGPPAVCHCPAPHLNLQQLDDIRVFACQLGIKSHAIPDSALSASSEWDARHAATRGRLDMFLDTHSGGKGGWCTKSNKADEWIQVDFGVATNITGVITQGRKEYTPAEWVSSFHVKYKDNLGNWVDVMENGSLKIFTGNEDRDTWKVNYFPHTVNAKIIRIVARTWVTHICMRFEVLGC